MTEPSAETIAQELDTSGLLCPLPVLKARRALNAMHSGQCLRVIATDAKAPADFAAFCQQSGCALLSVTQDGERYLLVVRKA